MKSKLNESLRGEMSAGSPKVKCPTINLSWILNASKDGTNEVCHSLRKSLHTLHFSIPGIGSMSAISSPVARRDLCANRWHRHSSSDPTGSDRCQLQRSSSEWFDAAACLCQAQRDQMRWFASSSRWWRVQYGQRTWSGRIYGLVLRNPSTERKHDSSADQQRSQADCNIEAEWDRHVSMQLRQEQSSRTIESLASSRRGSRSNWLRRSNAVASGQMNNGSIEDHSFSLGCQLQFLRLCAIPAR